MHTDLVLRVHLPRSPRIPRALPTEVVARAAGISDIGPGIGIAGVLVVEHTADIIFITYSSTGHEEPELVSDDRPAKGRVDVVGILDGTCRPQPQVPDALREVAALRAVLRAGDKQEAGEPVAAILGYSVHDDPAGPLLSGAARHVEDHFLGAAHIGRHRAEVVVRAPGPESIDQLPKIDSRAAMDRCGKEADAVRSADILRASGDSWYKHRETHRGSRGWQRVDHVPAQHLLFPNILDVDDGRCGGDRDRLGECADLELSVHDSGKRSGQLEAFASERAETW